MSLAQRVASPSAQGTHPHNYFHLTFGHNCERKPNLTGTGCAGEEEGASSAIYSPLLVSRLGEEMERDGSQGSPFLGFLFFFFLLNFHTFSVTFGNDSGFCTLNV